MVRSLFQAVVVPSGLSTTVQPIWWITTLAARPLRHQPRRHQPAHASAVNLHRDLGHIYVVTGRPLRVAPQTVHASQTVQASQAPQPSPAPEPSVVVRPSSPAALLAVVPHLVGFVPEASVVVIGTAPPRDRIPVTLRYDLPDPPHADLAADIAAHAVGVRASQGLSAAVAVGYGSRTLVTPAADEFQDAALEAGTRRPATGRAAPANGESTLDVLTTLYTSGPGSRQPPRLRKPRSGTTATAPPSTSGNSRTPASVLKQPATQVDE